MIPSPKIQPHLLIASVVVGCICVLLIGTFVWSAHIGRAYEGKILPNVSVATIDVGGLEESEAYESLRKTLQENPAKTITVRIQEQDYLLNADPSGDSFIEPSSALAKKAFLIGRSESGLRNTWDRVRLSLWSDINVPLSVEVRPERLQGILEPKLTSTLRPAVNATLAIDGQTGEARITPEQTGISIDWNDAATRVQNHLNRPQTTTVSIPVKESLPDITEADLATARMQAIDLLSKGPLRLIASPPIEKTWTLTTSTVASWITVTSTDARDIRIEFNPSIVSQTFHSWLGTTARAAQDGLLELDENGKLKTFIAPKEGFGPDTETTLQNIRTAWEQRATSTTFAIQTQKPLILGDAESLGIRELIGVGSSNFAGSPVNRRKNIQLGMERVHGTIVPAGGEFSMMKTLGEIDGAHGWLPELVIKGNKTVPEFGGGLCQIGTTAFRGAMNTGLQITERRNHSYRVRYYEPAGTDATLYDPSPDFKFKNDTPNAILITGEIRGDVVDFLFWGTSDGRKGSISPSRITKVIPPPPMKLIETTDLAPGVKKCTETAHAGATAQIDYIIDYANGESKKVTFTSVYRPWQAVCLIGVERISAPTTGVDQTGINNLN